VFLSRKDQFSAKKTVWRKPGKENAEQLTVIFVTGRHGNGDAIRGLFQVVGIRSTAAVGPASFIAVTDGPGDFCLAPSNCVTGRGEKTVAKRWIAFCRDSVALLLERAGTDNLLPIARALDAVVAGCPRSQFGANAED